MPNEADDLADQAVTFGPFRLLPRRKLLLEGEQPVRLGGRALDLLIALVERAGEVMSRDELEARVWPNTFVQETSLRVHVSTLRKALGDGHGSARFITNVPGRGYCFVAPVARHRQAPTAAETLPDHEVPHNLPARLTRMIGRAEAVASLRKLLAEARFVTVTGAGGMGKTTIALAVAEELLGSFRDGVRFVDLAPIADPSQLPGAVASTLEVSVPSENPLPALSASLRGKNMLIVLDNCDRMVQATAPLAESLLQGTSGISILTTSRERLNGEGESVYRLSSLEVPAESTHLTAAQALTFSAVQLFALRAKAISDAFDLSDADAPVVGELCRQLDGMPLAIEFAAARVESLGLRGLAAGLDDRLRLLTHGRRTALPRHRTLKAMLDWSCDLLAPSERTVLCRLGVFKASFTAEAACAVASGDDLRAADALECVMNLAAKSLISADASGDGIRFRLLESTRAYALEQLMNGGYSAMAFRRHALQMLDLLTRAEADWDALSRPQWMATYCRDMDDIRAALVWSFSGTGDAAIGIALTAAALLPVYELGLLDEHHKWVERALSRIHLLSPAQPVIEMRLNAALVFPSGRSMREGRPYADVVARILDLGHELGEPKYRIAALYGLWGKDFRAGDYAPALATAKEMSMLARDSADSAALLLSDRLLAQSHHFMGDHAVATVLAEGVLRHPPRRMPFAYISPVPYGVAMRIVLARVLWLRGCADQAVEVANDCIEQASEHPFAYTQALALAACPILLWRGDHSAARVLVDKLREHSARHPSTYWQSWGQSYDAVLSIRESRESASAPIRTVPQVQTTNVMELDCIGTLVEAPIGADTLLRVEKGLVGWCAPEILRVQGESILVQGSVPSAAASEALHAKSLALARRQGALAWQLRTATSLARLWRGQQRIAEARELLSATVGCFDEGLDTADMRAARRLLEALTI
ncbi:winged helix-turn-helix domain-containing protein [Piscinibacter sp. XHJ-5]|uniref:ATP-binding protein n=1 Tax=Piscinibacter sp. XHJ-5 TaxID=3037797 RepID=UPI0024534C1A|nr:winged helix-turn-helix domain-containing protein [Piscinibacter sp. XHJ-5]